MGAYRWGMDGVPHLVASVIKKSRSKAKALKELGIALVQAQQWERAEVVWTEAQLIAGSSFSIY